MLSSAFGAAKQAEAIMALKKKNAARSHHSSHSATSRVVSVASSTKKPDNVPRYEHPKLWTGHSTVVDEILRELAAWEKDDAPTILVSVGGGGLLCACWRGWNATSERDCRVIAAETVGASCFGQSFEWGGQVVSSRERSPLPSHSMVLERVST